MNDIVFSLDIGTRKIAALIAARHTPSVIEVIDFISLNHKNRAVRAGQIHDIESVARDIQEIKASLERNTGIELKKVATAIAGRNLKCFRSQGRIQFENFKEVSQDDIRQAELSAIHTILSTVGDEISDYYFVGYTTVKTELDSEPLTNPVGHYAQEVSLELISTFLPRKVLESLFAVTKKAGLEISYLTLEPIAASEAVLPQNIRTIPLILIDIGAGTSDIAILAQGTIQSFGMIPIAGDFITEAICNAFVVDFDEAERLKKHIGSQLNSQNKNVEQGSSDTLNERTISFTNIFSKTSSIPLAGLLEKIKPAVNEMSRQIAQEIKNIGYFKLDETGNFASPFAVVLVGGGSLTPFLTHELATALNIPSERVGLREPSMTQRFSQGSLIALRKKDGNLIPLLGPQAAVALGVSSLAFQSPPLALIHITVNEKKVDLLNFEGNKLNILSALIAAGISKQKIYGKPGLAKTLTLNGDPMVIKGTYPQPAEIKLNEINQNDLNTPLKEGDKITFIPAKDGSDARITVADIIAHQESVSLIINGNEKKVLFPYEVFINEKPASIDTLIEDRDTVQLIKKNTLTAILSAAGITIEKLLENNITIDINGEMVEKNVRNYILLHNNTPVDNLASINTLIVNSTDAIEFNVTRPAVKIKEVVPLPSQGNQLRVKINGEEFVFPGGMGKILLNGRPVDEDTEVHDGDIIRSMHGRDAEAALVDIFKYISVDPKDTMGKRLKLFVNQEEAYFTTPLTEGADVKVSFE